MNFQSSSLSCFLLYITVKLSIPQKKQQTVFSGTSLDDLDVFVVLFSLFCLAHLVRRMCSRCEPRCRACCSHNVSVLVWVFVFIFTGALVWTSADSNTATSPLHVQL